MDFAIITYGCETWTIKKVECWRIDALNYAVRGDFWESLRQQGDQFYKKSTLNIHWKVWCWSWSSNTLATWYEEPSHWKRPWCWERLEERGSQMMRWLDGIIDSVDMSLSKLCKTRKPDMLQLMWLQRVRHDWATEQKSKLWNICPKSELDFCLIVF